MAETSRPELCIVGAGALGIALAQYARDLGASVALVDRGAAEPGDGPQRALRVAALQASAARARAMRTSAELGLGNSDVKLSMKTVEERARQVAAERAPLDSHDRLRALGIEVVVGSTRFVDTATLMVEDMQIRAQAFVLAVGGMTRVPQIEGLKEAGYFTPDGLLDNSRKLTHLLVIGGDPEGLALAQAYRRLGSEVTIVPQGWALSDFDIETASILAQGLVNEGMRMLDGGRVRRIQPRSQGIGAIVDLADGSETALDLSHILVCDGAVPDLGELGIEGAKLRAVRGQGGRFAMGAAGQTSNRRVRVVGAAAAMEPWHLALAHGRSVIEDLVLGAPRHRPRILPRLVSTDPGLAQIGRLPVGEGKLATGHTILRANLAENDMARVQGQGVGLVKVLADAKGRIIGASLVGPGAGDLAAVLAMAMDRHLPVETLTDMPLPNPSLMGILSGLGGNRMAGRPVSTFARRRGALKRLLRL